MTDRSKRYENIPISDKTRQGMTLNIDDLQAISRLLMLQDDVYEDMFDELTQSMKDIKKVLANHESRICKLEKSIEKLTA